MSPAQPTEPKDTCVSNDMRKFMMGYGGTLIFWLDDAGNPTELEILAHWSPYTPAMECGKEYFTVYTEHVCMGQ